MNLIWRLRIVEERIHGVLVLGVAGRLGAAAAGLFDAAVADAIGRGSVRLVVDLSGVDYISSRGLHTLATSARRCADAGGALAVCGLADPVRIALDLSGLLLELAIAPSRDEAIARVARR
jgi:anti-sigma B factor antagonist